MSYFVPPPMQRPIGRPFYRASDGFNPGPFMGVRPPGLVDGPVIRPVRPGPGMALGMGSSGSSGPYERPMRHVERPMRPSSPSGFVERPMRPMGMGRPMEMMRPLGMRPQGPGIVQGHYGMERPPGMMERPQGQGQGMERPPGIRMERPQGEPRLRQPSWEELNGGMYRLVVDQIERQSSLDTPMHLQYRVEPPLDYQMGLSMAHSRTGSPMAPMGQQPRAGSPMALTSQQPRANSPMGQQATAGGQQTRAGSPMGPMGPRSLDPGRNSRDGSPLPLQNQRPPSRSNSIHNSIQTSIQNSPRGPMYGPQEPLDEDTMLAMKRLSSGRGEPPKLRRPSRLSAEIILLPPQDPIVLQSQPNSQRVSPLPSPSNTNLQKPFNAPSNTNPQKPFNAPSNPNPQKPFNEPPRMMIRPQAIPSYQASPSREMPEMRPSVDSSSPKSSQSGSTEDVFANISEMNMDTPPTFSTLRRRLTFAQSNAIVETKEKTIEMYRAKVYKSNDSVSQFEFARFLIEAGEQYLDQGFTILKKVAASGLADAQYYLGEGYIDDQKYDLAYSQFLHAAKKSHPPSCHAIGDLSEKGLGCRKNKRLAFEMYCKAASAGHIPSMVRLAQAEINGDLNLKPDVLKGVRWYKRAAAVASKEHPEALFELAEIYSNGYGNAVRADLNYAKSVLKEACDFEYAPALVKMGYCFERGQFGCPVNPNESIRLYTLAANKGNAEAQLSLAGWYMTGADRVIPKDTKMAFDLAKRAADQGLARAQYTLGYFYENGIGVEKSVGQAIDLFSRAAESGDSRALDRLVKMGSNEGQRIQESIQLAQRKRDKESKKGIFSFFR